MKLFVLILTLLCPLLVWAAPLPLLREAVPVPVCEKTEEEYLAQTQAEYPGARHDVMRFPNRRICASNIAFARQHIEWLNRQMSISRDEDEKLWEWHAEAIHLCKCWEALDFAWMFVTRDEDMVALKKIIGQDAYDKACMPPCVPIGRFRVLGK